MPKTIPHSSWLRLHECSCCTATRELAALHGTGRLLDDPGNRDAEVTELPQVRRAIEEDARNNRLTTILNTMRPFHAGAGDKDKIAYKRTYEQFVESVNLRTYEDLAELMRCKTLKPEDEQTSKKEDQIENYNITEHLHHVFSGIAEKIDDYKKFHEMPRHNTSKFGDVQINMMKYITSECLKNVLPKTTEKKDDYKELYEQLAEYTKPKAQEDSDDGTDIAALMRLHTSKFEDKQNESKEYVTRKREDQIHNYGNKGELKNQDKARLTRSEMSGFDLSVKNSRIHSISSFFRECE